MKMRKTVFMAVAAIAAVVAFADEGPTFNGAIGTGGTITAAKDTSGDAVHTFTESGFFTAPASADLQVRVLVVAGGGAGGRGTDNAYTCGGGGGGGVIFNDATTLLTIKAGETVTVTVGAGGQPAAVGTAANGGNGGDSRIVGNGFSYTALGGGGGGTKNANGSSGGNGGGGGGVGRSGGTYTQSFVWGSISYHGYSGGKGDAYCGSGGGGAGGNAPNNPNNDRPSNGGAGLASDITGETVYYAGGGGGGCSNTGNSTGYGGTGGGGHGAGCTVGGVVTRSVDLTNGTDGLGGGGGGGGGYWGSYDHKPLTGRGGSGVVIFRYTPVPRRVSTITSVGDATIGTVKFDVNVVDTGDDDQKVTVECAYAPTGSELGAYQTIATGVGNGSNVTKRIYGLTTGTTYDYSVRIVNETDSSKNQVLNGTFDAIPGVPATGDGEVTMLSDGSMLHKFTRVGTYKLNFPTTGDSDIRFLLVGGGGSGGRTANERGGGGGGGGGVLSNSVSQLITIAAGTEMTVTVGAGGVAPTAAARGENGGNTSISFGSTTYTALGGGGGGTSAQLGVAGGNSGGSGGGTNGSRTSGQQRAIDGTTLVGKSGGGGTAYAAGGGGGGGENGQDAGSDQPNRGGNGTPCDITGEVVMYAGGGGGGLDNIIPKQNINCGGVGGGGWGAGFCVAGIYQAAQDGENVLGGGGGGGGTGSGWSAAQEKFWTAGNGGSGCAYIRYMPSTTLPAAPVLSVTASELSLEDFTSTISYKTWYPGPGVDAVALSYAVTVDDTEPTDWTLLDSAQIGSGELDLAFAEIGVTYRVWFKAVGGGTPVVSMTTVVMPEATEVTLDEPSVDKDNFTIRFTGSVDSIGVGTTTLQLHYGKNEALGKIFDCGTAVEGDDPFDFDTGAIACKVPGDRMALVYYRYVMVETVHGVEVARIETPVRSVRVIPNGLMVIYY